MDSDPDIEFIEKDSGMSSLGGSKDETPERRAEISDCDETLESGAVVKEITASDTDNFDDEPDETLYERLWGLTEMFPEPIRNVCETVSDFSVSSTKAFYIFTCNASWIFFSSAIILYAPVLFEAQRAEMEELQRSQQKQVLLGPGSAISSAGSPGMPALPPMSSNATR